MEKFSEEMETADSNPRSVLQYPEPTLKQASPRSQVPGAVQDPAERKPLAEVHPLLYG